MTDVRKLEKAALAALEDIKAREVEVFDVTHLTSMFDRVIIASADSARQLKALASHVQENAKAADGRSYCLERGGGGGRVLLTLGGIILVNKQAGAHPHHHLLEDFGPPHPAEA